MFGSNEGGEGNNNVFNESSAGVIPINSMYDDEEERQAAIPPPREHDIIEESKDEQNVKSAHTDEQQQEPLTAVTQQNDKDANPAAAES